MKRIIISGGGTGGHIFPAIAIANALKVKVDGVDILFIGAKGRMEMEKVPAAGYRIEGLTISGFQRRMTLKNLTFPFKLLGSLMKARSIISTFNPELVIGVGGYASGPTLRIASDRGIPSLIQEQNSFPGVTNRLLGKRVQKICVAYDGMDKYFPKEKIVLTGNPIRKDVIDIMGKESEAQMYFGLTPGMKTLLVIGGSLGAGTINNAILELVRNKSGTEKNKLASAISDRLTGFQVLWQTGSSHFENIMTSLRANETKNENLVILPFIDRMDLAYAVADLIVSRAGAIAISELCVVGKPVILIPSPNVAEDHQMKNARALQTKNAALVISDHEVPEILGKTITNVFEDETLQTELKKNIAALGIKDAAEKIADEALKLINENA